MMFLVIESALRSVITLTGEFMFESYFDRYSRALTGMMSVDGDCCWELSKDCI